MAEVLLSIGANLGDRNAALQSVVDAMHEGFTDITVSRVFETPPWGNLDQPAFLNAAIRAQTTLTPEEVLAFAHQCEDRAARVRDVRWGPRTLDVDVIAYDELEQSDPSLTLPHPRAWERAFVLVCLADIDRAFRLHGSTVGELLGRQDLSGIRVVGALEVTK